MSYIEASNHPEVSGGQRQFRGFIRAAGIAANIQALARQNGMVLPRGDFGDGDTPRDPAYAITFNSQLEQYTRYLELLQTRLSEHANNYTMFTEAVKVVEDYCIEKKVQPILPTELRVVENPQNEIDQVQFRRFIRAVNIAGKIQALARQNRMVLPRASLADGINQIDPSYGLDFDDNLEQIARDLEHLQARLLGKPQGYDRFTEAVRTAEVYCTGKGYTSIL